LRYCSKTKAIVGSSYLSVSLDELQEMITDAGLTPRSKESLAQYIAKLEGASQQDCRKIVSEMNPELYRAKTLYHGAKHRAKVKGIDFDLTVEWILERITKGRCAVSGIKFKVKTYNPDINYVNPYAPSVDQIIPSAGYTKKNCRLVVDFYNKLKNDRSDVETLNFCRELLTNYVNNKTVLITG